MAIYQTEVEIKIKVKFEGTQEQFDALTHVLLAEEAEATVKSLLPPILTQDPTFTISASRSFGREWFSDKELESDPSTPWARRPVAVLTASLPEPEEEVS